MNAGTVNQKTPRSRNASTTPHVLRTMGVVCLFSQARVPVCAPETMAIAAPNPSAFAVDSGATVSVRYRSSFFVLVRARGPQ